MIDRMLHRCLLFISAILLSLNLAHTQNVEVIFQVDMSNETVSPDGIHVAGNFQSAAGFGSDWDPGATVLSDDNGNNIYTIAVKIPPSTYEYKFINGNSWGSDENPPSQCSVGNTNNREITIGSTDFEIPVVPFNQCLASISFSINMTGTEVAQEGVHLMGNFQESAGFAENWDPTSLKLEDVNGDNTYEVDIVLPAGDYEYLYVNGNTNSDIEQLSDECATIGSNGTNNRSILVTSDTPSPPTYCFNTCEECDPDLNIDYDTYWWNEAVFYEIFVRSFYDSDGDGIGDFQGIIEKLDYLNDGDPTTNSDLGITAIWLMPMMESPSYHGYDVTNYYAVEPDYGSMEDFENFLDEAHSRGIKVIIDLVLNHTSSQHPWFTQSANGNDEFRDWYIWSNNNPGFSGPWGQGVWHGNSGDYYYGLFWGGMPDLNFNHQPVKEEMFEVVNFWLDKGIDGFRLDAIKYLIEDGTILENTPETFSLLEDFNDLYKENNPDAFTIGEVWSTTSSIIPYVQNDRLDVCFDFDLAGNIISAVNDQNPIGVKAQMETIKSSYPALQYGTFLTNHDIDRIYNQIGTNAEKMKLAASIYLMLPGIPFIYYGEEVSMIGTGAHENIRRPMQWSGEANSGFSEVSPWNAVGPNYISNNVNVMEADPNSILNHYKKLIHLRNEQEVLKKGNYLNVNSSENSVLSFARVYENEAALVLSNLSTSSLDPTLSLSASSLTAGEYFITDLNSEEGIGVLTINENGGFDNWVSPTPLLTPRSTKILLISENNPVNTFNLDSDQSNLKLYPNPSRGIINIEVKGNASETAKVKVFSSNGSQVYKGEVTKQALILQTSKWQSGIYLVQLLHEGKLEVKRFVVL